MAGQLAELIQLPCLAACSRMAWNRKDRRSGYRKKNFEGLREYLADPQNESVTLDNGRSGDLVASARFATGVEKNEGIPLLSYVAVPPASEAELIEAACQVARALRVLSGAICLWPEHRNAQTFAFSMGLTDGNSSELRLSALRLRQWRANSRSVVRADREIAGPEWGLFLSAGHLERLSLATLRDSGVFHLVRSLGEGLVYLQLTANSRDMLGEDWNQTVERARAVLAPIQVDLSQSLLQDG